MACLACMQGGAARPRRTEACWPQARAERDGLAAEAERLRREVPSPPFSPCPGPSRAPPGRAGRDSHVLQGMRGRAGWGWGLLGGALFGASGPVAPNLDACGGCCQLAATWPRPWSSRKRLGGGGAAFSASRVRTHTSARTHCGTRARSAALAARLAPPASGRPDDAAAPPRGGAQAQVRARHALRIMARMTQVMMTRIIIMTQQ